MVIHKHTPLFLHVQLGCMDPRPSIPLSTSQYLVSLGKQRNLNPNTSFVYWLQTQPNLTTTVVLTSPLATAKAAATLSGDPHKT